MSQIVRVERPQRFNQAPSRTTACDATRIGPSVAGPLAREAPLRHRQHETPTKSTPLYSLRSNHMVAWIYSGNRVEWVLADASSDSTRSESARSRMPVTPTKKRGGRCASLRYGLAWPLLSTLSGVMTPSTRVTSCRLTTGSAPLLSERRSSTTSMGWSGCVWTNPFPVTDERATPDWADALNSPSRRCEIAPVAAPLVPTR